MEVFDADGNLITDIPVSEKQQQMLDAGELVTVLYHTPKALQQVLGQHSGSFTLRKVDDKLVTPSPGAVQDFADLQQRVAAARRAK